MPVNSTQYRGAVEIFNSQHFVLELKHKSLPLLSYSDNVFFFFSYYVFFFRNIILLFLFLAVFLILKLNSRKKTIIHMHHAACNMVSDVSKTWLASRDVELTVKPHEWLNHNKK